jgi:hypothetical protein
MRHSSDGLDILDKGRFESSGVRSDIVDESRSARREAARTRGVKGWAPLHHIETTARWARRQRKHKGRLDKYYKLVKYVDPFHLLLQPLEHITQRTRVPCTFRVQADPAEQELLLLGIRTTPDIEHFFSATVSKSNAETLRTNNQTAHGHRVVHNLEPSPGRSAEIYATST